MNLPAALRLLARDLPPIERMSDARPLPELLEELAVEAEVLLGERDKLKTYKQAMLNGGVR